MGDRIARRMRVLDLSQAQLARELEVTRGAVWLWLNDERMPSPKLMPRLASLLDTTIGHLYGECAA